MADHRAFWDHLASHFLDSLEKQHRLDQLIEGSGQFRFDKIAGVMRFGDDRKPMPMQILGTHAEGDNTWLWAWANEQSGIDARLLESARLMQSFGQRHAIGALIEAVHPIDRVDGYAIAQLAAGVCGADAYYRCPYPGGAAYVLLFDKRIAAKPGFDAAQLRRWLDDALSWMDDEPRYPLDMRKAFMSFSSIAGTRREIGGKLAFRMGDEQVFAGFADDATLNLLRPMPAGPIPSVADALPQIPAILSEVLPPGWREARYRANFMPGGTGGELVEWKAEDGDFQELEIPAVYSVKFLNIDLSANSLAEAGIDVVKVRLNMTPDGSFTAQWRGIKETDDQLRKVAGRWAKPPEAVAAIKPKPQPVTVNDPKPAKRPWWKLW